MRWVNKTDLAELSGVTWKTVKKRLDEAGLKPDGEGNYRSDEALKAILAPEEGGKELLDLASERARLASEQADRIAMLNAEKRRELVPLPWVSAVVARQCGLIGAIFDGVVPKLRRMNATLTAFDLEIVEKELTRARNVAAQFNLTDSDLHELGGSADGTESGLSEPVQDEPKEAESVG